MQQQNRGKIWEVCRCLSFMRSCSWILWPFDVFLNPIKYGFFKDKRVGFRTVVAMFVLFSLCFHSSKPPKNEGHGWKSCWNMLKRPFFKCPKHPKLGPTSNQRYSMAGFHPGLGIGFRSRCNIWQEEILNDQTPSSKGTFGIFGLENLWLNAGYKGMCI